MNRRVFLASLAGTSLAADFPALAVALQGTTVDPGVRLAELDAAHLPATLSDARQLRARLSTAGVAVVSVALTLERPEGLDARLASANALDVRFVAVRCPATLAPALNAATVRTAVPIALRNGAEGLRTPDELMATLKANRRLGIALDAHRMLADGHDPALFLRRAAARALSVTLASDLDQAVATSVVRLIRTRRMRTLIMLDPSGPDRAAALRDLRKLVEEAVPTKPA